MNIHRLHTSLPINNKTNTGNSSKSEGRRTQTWKRSFQNPSSPAISTRNISRQSRTELLPKADIQDSLNKAIQLINKKGIHAESFNAFIDKARKKCKSPSEFQLHIKQCIQSLSHVELSQLARTPEIKTRGFDREGLVLLYKILHLECSKRGIAADINLTERVNRLHNTTIIQENVELEVLGQGAVNKVYKGEFKAPDGTTFSGVFKPEASSLPTHIRIKESLFGTAALSGISMKNPFLSERSVATSLVDTLVYNENGVCVKTYFAIINGQRGIVMETAKGGSPKVVGFHERKLLSENESEARVLKYFKEKKASLSKDDLAFFARALGCRELKVKNGEIYRIDPTFENFDSTNTTTANDLLKQQCLDWITGQVDRHPGNYSVNPETGNIKAFDNDCSFGHLAVPKNKDVRKQSGIVPNRGSLMLRMPSVVTSEVGFAILNIKDEPLRSTLKDLLSEKEIEAAIVRLNLLQGHIRSSQVGVNCYIVETSKDLLSPGGKKRQTPNNSYWAREVEALMREGKYSNWNHLRTTATSAA